MKEFAEIIKKSHVKGNNKKKIIYFLLQAAGAKGVVYETSDKSPSESTIQNWLSEKGGKPGVSRYFPDFKIEDEKGASDFLRKTPKKDQWIELRDLFKEWRNNNQNVDKDFYIDTETDDFDTFNISFWKQFIFYFDSLHLWEGAEEQQLEIEDNRENVKSDLANKMKEVFKKNFMQYRVYEFIPKEISDVINSLDVYYEILNAQTELIAKGGSISEYGLIREYEKMYCKWVANYDCFVFCAVACHKAFWELKTPEGYVIIKCNEDFTSDRVLINEWISSDFKYAVAKSSMFQDEQFDEEEFIWKEGQGKIIIVDISQLSVVEGTRFIIEDCYDLFDEMLKQDHLIDEFTTVISEKIIKKYEGLTFDNNLRLLYNDIGQYIKSLSDFKEYLMKFRDLKKEKSQYFSDQAFIEAFGMYSSLSDFEVSPKPIYPLSECYLNLDEARKVQSELCRCHKNLIELYAEIINYEGNCTI